MKKTFSYSSKELSKPKQFIVNSIEKISGRKKLEKLYQQYDEENREPHLFWTDVKNLLKLKTRKCFSTERHNFFEHLSTER